MRSAEYKALVANAQLRANATTDDKLVDGNLALASQAITARYKKLAADKLA
jgi:hypothetical protein